MSTAGIPDANAPEDRPETPDPGQLTRSTWLLIITAGLVSGLGSWGIVEGLLHHYHAAFEPRSKPYPSAEDTVRINRAIVECVTIALGATGGLLGVLVALAAAGSSRTERGSAVRAVAAGLLIGGLVEAGVAWLTLSVFYRHVDPEDMLQTLLSRGALWAVVGVGSGLALGIGIGGSGRWWRASVGGLLGVSVASAAYEVIGALAFPTEGTQMPIAESAVTRAIAQLLIPLGAVVGAGLASRALRPKKGSKPAPAPDPSATAGE